MYYINETLELKDVLLIDKDDTIGKCRLAVYDFGVEHPIMIRDGAVFEDNHIDSEVISPIKLVDYYGTNNFRRVKDNFIRQVRFS